MPEACPTSSATLSADFFSFRLSFFFWFFVRPEGVGVPSFEGEASPWPTSMHCRVRTHAAEGWCCGLG